MESNETPTHYYIRLSDWGYGGDICLGINLLHCFGSEDQIKQLKPLSCPPQQQRGILGDISRHLRKPQKINSYEGVEGVGWRGLPLSNFENPFVNSLLNPWSSNRIEIARRIGSAELDSLLLSY
ncbi:hypothetical protein CDAR_111151 [Caerostris darwini]|uniref:Maturase K n=1 Tax=Caerostris darwini TaxID=1538125 RepID=A0AAV4SVY9_9ARAC|nr:hypothetical protein CDAR_111151 [Caerostris darwini]